MATNAISWFGGKGLMYAEIVGRIPPHHVYTEAFGGGAAVLLNKAPAPVEVYNDVNSGLVNFFRTLKDPAKFEAFERMANLTPYAREEFDFCRYAPEEGVSDVELAFRFFLVARQSFSGDHKQGGWARCIQYSKAGMAANVRKWLLSVEGLEQVARRLLRVQVEHKDFRDVILDYDTEHTFHYLDPPYVKATRKRGGYAHEMSDQDHADLVDILLGIKGMAMLSGYENPIYEPLEAAGWQRVDINVQCSSGAKTTRATTHMREESQRRIECLWVSPNAQAAGQQTFAL